MKRGKTKPAMLSAVLPRVMSDLGLEDAALATRIAERWEEIVGPEIAQHSRPTAIRAGALDVTVRSSVWCHQLQFRRAEMCAALRDAFGEDAPSDVRLRLG